MSSSTNREHRTKRQRLTGKSQNNESTVTEQWQQLFRTVSILLPCPSPFKRNILVSAESRAVPSVSCISFEASWHAALQVAKQLGAQSCLGCSDGGSARYLFTSTAAMVSGSISKQNQQGFPCVKENQIRKANPVGPQAVVFPASFPRGLWKSKYHLLCFAQLLSIPPFFF